MRISRIVLALLLVIVPSSVLAEITIDKIPAAAVWYFHADLEAMRSGEASRSLYEWVDDEVFDDLREELGVDLGKEVNQVTAFAAAENGVVVVIDGSISQDSRDKILAIATLAGDMQTLESNGKTYYYAADRDGGHGGETGIGSIDDAAYFSFALKDKIIVTSAADKMKSLLSGNGKISAPEKHDRALFVLSAKRSLMQAGVKIGEFGHDNDWDSNILRNAKQVAVLVAEEGGKISIEARLVTMEPEMADSLASIARGLISLQAFSDDLEPGIKDFLNNTRVDVEGSSLRLRLALDPDVLIGTISD